MYFFLTFFLLKYTLKLGTIVTLEVIYVRAISNKSFIIVK